MSTAATLALAASLLVAVVAVIAGARARHRAGSPERALVVVAAVVVLPAALLVVLSEAAPARSTADPVSELRRAAAARVVVGQAALSLSLPVGLAAGLWAGLAAGWRSRRAGERARLSAAAAGYPRAGQLAASVLDRTQAPALGLLAGFIAALATAPVSLATLRAGRSLAEGLDLAAHLGAGGSALALQLVVTGAARTLQLGATVSGAGAIVTAAILAALHIGSSRRRNLAAAVRALHDAGHEKPAVAAVTSALSATGKPGPAGPLTLAAALLVLAALAMWRSGSFARPQAGEALSYSAGSPGVNSSTWR